MKREDEFEKFLIGDKAITSQKAVSSRMSNARKAEAILGQDLDLIVADDDLMYDSLIELKQYDNKEHAPMQNAVRKYYKFQNGKEFPQCRHYKK